MEKKRLKLMSVALIVCFVILASVFFVACGKKDEKKESAIAISNTISNGAVVSDVEKGKEGDTITLTVTSDAGYALKGGSLKANNGAVGIMGDGSPYTFVMPAEDVEIIAVFEKQSYAVNISSMQNGTVTATNSAVKGDTISLAVWANDGYKLKAGSLKVNNGAVAIAGDNSPYTFVMPISDVSVTAEFEKVSYAVNIAQMQNGRVVANNVSLKGDTVTLEIFAEQGYALKTGSLKVNGGAIEITEQNSVYTFTMPTADVSVTAEFEKISHVVNIAPMENGKIVANNVSLKGDTVTLEVFANEGYQLDERSLMVDNGNDSVAATESGYTFTMPAKDVTVTASFAKLYNINFYNLNNGKIISNVTKAIAGTEINLEAISNTGYTFTENSVIVNGESIEGTSFIMPEKDVNITAKFTATRHNIKVVINEEVEHSGTIDVISRTSVGDVVSVKVSATLGFGMVAGSLKINDGDVKVLGTYPNYSFVMPTKEAKIELAFAQETDANKFKFTLSDDSSYYTVAAKNATSLTGDIIVPLEYNNLPVSKLADGAFWTSTNITSITLSENIKEIPLNAFRGCVALTEVLLHNGIISIRERAFQDCRALKNIVFPAALESMDTSYLFSNCESLTEVSLPKCLGVINQDMFKNCKSLKRVYVNSQITLIAGSSFAGCENLEYLNIPSSVKFFGNCVFVGCEKLTIYIEKTKVSDYKNRRPVGWNSLWCKDKADEDDGTGQMIAFYSPINIVWNCTFSYDDTDCYVVMFNNENEDFIDKQRDESIDNPFSEPCREGYSISGWGAFDASNGWNVYASVEDIPVGSIAYPVWVKN